jgi:hypothetical protein
MKPHDKLYVQYGCGPCAPEGWLNFDASPTMFFERIPLLGRLCKKNNFRFASNVRYGDIVKGLPIANDSADGLYASHVLEHLAFEDCKKALTNSYALLKVGGRFRLIVPNLKMRAEKYVATSTDPVAASAFIQSMGFGETSRPRGVVQRLAYYFGNGTHLWMWDEASMTAAIRAAGFSHVRRCDFGDSGDPMFALVEERERFCTDNFRELAMEAIK